MSVIRSFRCEYLDLRIVQLSSVIFWVLIETLMNCRLAKITSFINEFQFELPILWMSPDAVINKELSQKSDVWAYGILLWEIFSLGLMPLGTLEAVKFAARAFAD